MNWIINLFKRRRLSSAGGAVVFLDRDILSKEAIEQIKLRMTPVFVEFSSFEMKHGQMDVQKAVIESPEIPTR